MEATAERSQRLETVVAILIALVTVVGALVAWRSSIADDSAGDADFAGLRASVRAQETRALNYVDAYESFGAYANYKRYQELGNLIAADQASAPENQALVLERERADNHDLSISNQRLFPNKFLDRNGSYNVNRQLGEMWADAAKENDLNPTPQFAEADQQRGKSLSLLIAASVLAAALVFYTLVESFGPRMQYVMTALGSLCFIAGTAFALLIELRA